ncbi:ankyrin repeat domain-containing protein 33B [Nematolebias whitei]|uniref:ankyrin repeat domain-containing protein 33B n=1 Tax=Nematolebias whitei TaxID=451745 RepID=UPI001897C782|nr:ankyrin repeat domain-containing protein 33B [Nematolebias whitei]
MAIDTPVMSISKVDRDGLDCDVSEMDEEIEVDYTWTYWEDEDDIYQEFEELDFDALPDCSDTRSFISNDSFYPLDDSVISHIISPEPISFFKACCNNNTVIVKIMIRQGVTEEEVKETDRNKRVGVWILYFLTKKHVIIILGKCIHLSLLTLCFWGHLCSLCSAGHSVISQYLLNYFPGLDIERRNCHGFTALMKAAMQGRHECVRALMLAGGDIQARDDGRRMTPREWALFTGRHVTANLMLRLMSRPCAEQFCDSFSLEWSMLEELVSEAQRPKTCWRHISNLLSCCSYRFFMNNKIKPVDDGVLDHMVQITTGISSPFIATACHTVCPGSPPCIGKRRPAVQEILRRQRVAELKRLGPDRLNNYKRFFQNSRVLLIPKVKDRRASLQPQILREVATMSTMALRRASLLPLNMLRRSSVRPGIVVPKVLLCKAPPQSFIPAKLKRNNNQNQLQIPKWNYKMKTKEKRQEEERQRLFSMRRVR